MNRREMLRATGVVAGALAVKAVAQNAGGSAQPGRKSKIVITGGHPGDPEYGCGGTIARLTASGHEVVLLYMNDGAWQKISAAVALPKRRRLARFSRRGRPMPSRSMATQSSTMTTIAHFKTSSNRRTRTPSSLIGSSITIPITARLPILPTNHGSNYSIGSHCIITKSPTAKTQPSSPRQPTTLTLQKQLTRKEQPVTPTPAKVQTFTTACRTQLRPSADYRAAPRKRKLTSCKSEVRLTSSRGPALGAADRHTASLLVFARVRGGAPPALLSP